MQQLHHYWENNLRLVSWTPSWLGWSVSNELW